MNSSSMCVQISLGGKSIRIRSTGPVSSQLVRFLFSDILIKKSCSSEPTISVSDSTGGNIHLDWSKKTNEQIARPGYYPLSDAPLVLWSIAQYMFCDGCDDGLMLHAAALRINGRLVIFPGSSGSGKTSLALILTSLGADYITDELVHVEPETQISQGLTRPLNVKTEGAALIASTLREPSGNTSHLTTSVGSLVPHRNIKTPSITYPARPEKATKIIFPTYNAGGPLKVDETSNATATMLLLSCLVNARNLPNDGITNCKQLAQAVPVLRMSYGDADQLQDAIRPQLIG